MSANVIALSGFRKLYRSAKGMFGADKHAFLAARQALKVEFKKNQNVANTAELGEYSLVILFCVSVF